MLQLPVGEGVVKAPLNALFRAVKRAGGRVAAPLRRNGGPNKFDLSSVDTATTTYEGDEGWAKRPPATLECPQCGGEILQHSAGDTIDCPHCVAEFGYEEFTELELLYLSCPVCRSRMLHGQRHPERFDIPEWATCDSCRYHWEFKHSYARDRRRG
jgi:Zn finger protein HypA/HybF involved in hydrogenase expression